VPYDCQEMHMIAAEIKTNIGSFNQHSVLILNDVADAVCSLKSNKNDGLTTNYVIKGSDKLLVHMSLLFSATVAFNLKIFN